MLPGISFSLKLTKTAPESRPFATKETSLPVSQFQERTVSFREGGGFHGGDSVERKSSRETFKHPLYFLGDIIYLKIPLKEKVSPGR